MSCDNEKQALLQAIQGVQLPQGVAGPEWQSLSDEATHINDLAIAWANGACKHDVSDMTGDLQKKTGNLADMAAAGTLDTQAHGAEIATVLNSYRGLPGYINSM